MTLLCAITYTDPAGERRTVFDGTPRCETEAEVPAAIRPALARVARERGADVCVAVVDDVSGRCVVRGRVK